MSTATDRHLLFGLLALQTGLIRPDQLVAAFHAWTNDKALPLGDHLIALGHLDEARRAAIDAMTRLYVDTHGGDTGRSLESVPLGASTRIQLTSLADPDLSTTMNHAGRPEEDDDRGVACHPGESIRSGPRFHVLRPHARGGLGAVYVALDTELNREVALKQILDHHADNRTSRQRFLVEAEITGGLEHPGIVPVYGLGAHGNGRPYYAMRFIRGDSLREAIEKFHKGSRTGPGRSLEFRQLLKRFTDVCNAVGYAHSRGVLHRDIKPGNVIVGKHGETLVVDWGLAKALGQSDPASAERTLIPASSGDSSETMPGQALGTPAYMSPEQAVGDLDRLGPRSDVYSLGATLHCLLTGKSPFEGHPAAVLLAVKGGDFRRPRAVDPSIDPALEAIVLKAMARDPSDRYESARALADDVDRWLADERVGAYPEPWTRGLNRWLTRHRTAVTGVAAAGIMALVGLAILSGVQTKARRDLDAKNAELTRANADLEAQRNRAEQREAQAIDAVKRFRDVVAEDAELKGNPALESLRKALLKEPLSFFGALRGRLQADRDTRPESLARLSEVIHDYAHLTEEVGNLEDGLKAHDEALAIREGLVRDRYDPGHDLAELLNCRASFLDRTGRVEEAFASRERAREIALGLASGGPEASRAWSILGTSLNGIGQLLTQTGRYAEALAAYREALEIRRRVADEAPEDARFRQAVAFSRTNIGDTLAHLGRPAEALEEYGRACSALEALPAPMADRREARGELASVHKQAGKACQDLGRVAEALVEFEKSHAIRRALVARNPRGNDERNDLAVSLHGLANVHRKLGKTAEAWGCIQSSLAAHRRLVEENPSVIQFRVDLASSLDQAGKLLRSDGRAEEAVGTLQKSLAIREELIASHPDFPHFRYNLAISRYLLGNALYQSGRLGEASRSYEDALTILMDLAAAQPEVAENQLTLATIQLNVGMGYQEAGRAVEALETYGKGLDLLGRWMRDHPDLVEFRQQYGEIAQEAAGLLRRLGRTAEADESRRKALAVRRGLAEGFPNVVDYRHDLALTLRGMALDARDAGRSGEVRKALDEALAIHRELVREHPDRPEYAYGLAQDLNTLGIGFRLDGRLDEAIGASREALAIRRRLVEEVPTSRRYRNDLAGSLRNLANQLEARGPVAEALGMYEEAISLTDRLAEETGGPGDYRLAHGQAQLAMGKALALRGNSREALASCQAALDMLGRIAREEPQRPEVREDLTDAFFCKGNLLIKIGRPGEAAEAYGQAEATARGVLEESPRNARVRRLMAGVLNNAGLIALKNGHAADAIGPLREGADFAREEAEGGERDQLRQLSTNLIGLGVAQRAAGRPDEAMDSYLEALRIQSGLVSHADPLAEDRYELALIFQNMANLLGSLRRPEAAIGALNQARAELLDLATADGSPLHYSRKLSELSFDLGRKLRDAGKPAEALETLEAARKASERVVDRPGAAASDRYELALIHQVIGGLHDANPRSRGQAIDSYQRAVVILRALVASAPEHPDYAPRLGRILASLGRSQRLVGRPASEAIANYDEARAILEKLSRADPGNASARSSWYFCLVALGNLQREVGRMSEASVHLEEAIKIARPSAVTPALGGSLGATLNDLALVDLAECRYADARDKLAEATALQRKNVAANPKNASASAYLGRHLANRILAERGLGDEGDVESARLALARFEEGDPQTRALNARLDALLAGEAPRDQAEPRSMAEWADAMARFGDAARLYADLLPPGSALLNDRVSQLAWNAARASIVAASRRDAEEAAVLRGRALRWLTDDLASWERWLNADRANHRPAVERALNQWRKHGELAPVREPSRIDRLPEAERPAWRRLWEAVEALHEDASTP